MTYPPTLVIGDVHGHDDRLEALLLQEGLIDGDGRRLRTNCRIIQLGDLGHYGWNGDEDGDRRCWVYAKRWINVVLWGNHDRATVDAGHAFSGYSFRCQDTRGVMNDMRAVGRLRFAAGAHGHLLTHAGLHPAFEADVPKDLDDAIRWLNNADGQPVVNAISRARGGRHLYGGILWRDHEEDLSDRWPQVYGHTRADDIRRDNGSWCIDVGSADNGRLAAIWLPEMRVVQVGEAPAALSSTGPRPNDPQTTPDAAGLRAKEQHRDG